MSKRSSSFINFKEYIIIIGITLLCYGWSLDGEFVFDDIVAIVKNPDVINKSQQLSSTNSAANNQQHQFLIALFTHDFWGYNLTDKSSHKSYRPVTILMFHLESNYLYNGLNNLAMAMKSMNLLLHLFMCCALLPVIYNRILFGGCLTQNKRRSRIVTFIATILFAVHPIHTEAVAGIVGRADLLCTIFSLLTFIVYMDICGKEKETHQLNKYDIMISGIKLFFKYVLLITLSCIAMLCKETGIMILPICLTYDLFYNTKIIESIQGGAQFNRNNIMKGVIVLRLIVISSVTVILIYLRLSIQKFESPDFKIMDNPIGANTNFVHRILSQNYLYTINLWLLICPDWLSFDWAFHSITLIETLSDIRIGTILLMYFCIIILTIYGGKNCLFAMTLIIIPFLPASGLIRVGFVIAERILYMPSIGYCLLIAIGYERLLNHFNSMKMVWYFAISIMIGIFTLKTFQRASEWKTEQTLFESGLRVCPNNAKIYYNIARLASDRQEYKIALKNYHRAIELYPEYESALMNLGNLYREQNDLKNAEYYLKRSIKVLHEFPAAWMNLGIVQTNQRKYEDALNSYHMALRYRKRYSICHYNMGNLYLEMKNFTMAMKCWYESIAINPNHGKAWSNILTLLDNNAELQQVLMVSEKALKYLKTDSSIYFIRANAFGKLKQFELAEEHYRLAIALKPNYPLYYINFGILYHHWKRKSNAIEMYQKALKIDPTLKSAKDNLMKLL